MKFQNVKDISKIRDAEKETPEAKIVRLEEELAAEKEDKLTIMEATAQVYEELLALKEKIGGTT
ncbi:hypothetical protein [Brevibacillus borstelensis]|jgi:hypothetical protein|uniref:hypothetical protein n=1 Tax=Brevibacillus borstelensis TaxID=45462 RepID=UPI0004F3E98C|nr:hypothetical protein [Brevibacillus borstelensis]KKX52965.1 hypothetical protein X546_22130 [Brevibacillus borstelensis cifa_chp40]MED2006992.1 hypothetical protein [Brevibacillus borstelensis]